MNDSPTAGLEFPPVTAAEWRARVEAELGERDFEHELVSNLDGMGRVEPLYTAAGAAALTPLGDPGRAPWVRGVAADGNAWTICPIYSRWSPEEVRLQILADLRGGADGVHLRFDRAVRRGAADATDVGRDGIVLYRLDDLRSALDGVHLGMLHLCLEAGGRGSEAAALLLALAGERGLDLDTLRVSFGLDPLGTLATDGALPRSLDSYDVEMAALCRHVATEMREARVITVSSRGYHNAGANPALELACVIGSCVEYLRRLGGQGVAPAEVARRTELSITVGEDLFVEISKLRALRALWGRVLEVVASEPVPPFVRAVSSERSLSVRDPWVNMLRVTAHALAAAVGGAQLISTASFDQAAGDATDLARRVARNTQLILGEESGLTTVVDPAGGSYFVETLTRQLADEAWSIFRRFERGGGFAHALLAGEVRALVAESWDARRHRLDHREQLVTGVSAYPNLREELPQTPPSLPIEEARWIAASATAAEPGTGAGSVESGPLSVPALVDLALSGESVFVFGGPADGVTLAPLPRHNDGERFEELRARGERLAQPAVFLANIGTLREHGARASFVRDSLAVGGLACESGSGTGQASNGQAGNREAGNREPGGDAILAELVAQFRDSRATAACLCGTDAAYERSGRSIVRALAAAGATALLVAGRPPSSEALSSAGVLGFVTATGDLVALLEHLLATLESDDV